MGATPDPTLGVLRLAGPRRLLAAMLAEHAACCCVCAARAGMTVSSGMNLVGTQPGLPALLAGKQQQACGETGPAQAVWQPEATHLAGAPAAGWTGSAGPGPKALALSLELMSFRDMRPAAACPCSQVQAGVKGSVRAPCLSKSPKLMRSSAEQLKGKAQASALQAGAHVLHPMTRKQMDGQAHTFSRPKGWDTASGCCSPMAL